MEKLLIALLLIAAPAQATGIPIINTQPLADHLPVMSFPANNPWCYQLPSKKKPGRVKTIARRFRHVCVLVAPLIQCAGNTAQVVQVFIK